MSEMPKKYDPKASEQVAGLLGRARHLSMGSHTKSRSISLIRHRLLSLARFTSNCFSYAHQDFLFDISG